MTSSEFADKIRESIEMADRIEGDDVVHSVELPLAAWVKAEAALREHDKWERDLCNIIKFGRESQTAAVEIAKAALGMEAALEQCRKHTTCIHPDGHDGSCTQLPMPGA